MKQNRHPRRQRKGDRLLNPDASKAEVMCDYAVAPMDRLARQLEEKWGVDRLPELVSVETAEKYGSAIAKLNAALDMDDPEEVKKRAAVCIRGLQAMDREAEVAGQPKASAAYWEHEIDGFKFAVIKDKAYWQQCVEERPDLRFFTMQEIGVALKALRIDNPIFAEVKKHFPASEVTSIAERATPPQLEDPIPFYEKEVS